MQVPRTAKGSTTEGVATRERQDSRLEGANASGSALVFGFTDLVDFGMLGVRPPCIKNHGLKMKSDRRDSETPSDTSTREIEKDDGEKHSNTGHHRLTITFRFIPRYRLGIG